MTAASNSYVARFLPLRLPRVCVAVTDTDPAALVDKAEALVRDNTFLEFRLDYLPRPALALPRIKRFIEYHPHVTAIATCRRTASGGKFKGSLAAQLDILGKASASGCQLLDIELQSAAKCKPEQVKRLRTRSALILSYHDFRATRNLDLTLEKMVKIPADFYKIVGTATTLYDNVTMMKFLEKFGDRHSLVGLCMGEQGIISRLLGVRAGSVFTFAAVSPDEKTAPGQTTAQELRSTYRIEQMDAATRIYGVAGDPVAHSLSPAIMNAALRRENVNGVYLALHAKTLKDLLACVRDIPIHGLSITMPYKEAILKHLDNTDSHTTKIGACNTVVRAQDGKLYGFNTDTAGVVRPLEQRITIERAKILVLGAGGAARGVLLPVLAQKPRALVLSNRTQAKADALAAAFAGRGPVSAAPPSDLAGRTFDVVINATSAGLAGDTAWLWPDRLFRRDAFAYDMIYADGSTMFLRWARAQGVDRVADGIGMLIEQAAESFFLWRGVRPDTAPVFELLRPSR